MHVRLIFASATSLAALLLMTASASAQQWPAPPVAQQQQPWTTQQQPWTTQQQQPVQWGTPQQPGYGTPNYGTPGYPAQGYATPTYGYPAVQQPTQGPSSFERQVEKGVLYGTAAAYGTGLGIWLDSETGLNDPGLKFIPPVALGLAAPATVFLIDQADSRNLPAGLPAALSAGMIIGAGEGLGIWSYQYTSTNDGDAWGFRGLSRAMTLGSTLGGVTGFAIGYYQEPKASTSAFVGSSVVWG